MEFMTEALAYYMYVVVNSSHMKLYLLYARIDTQQDL